MVNRRHSGYLKFQRTGTLVNIHVNILLCPSSGRVKYDIVLNLVYINLVINFKIHVCLDMQANIPLYVDGAMGFIVTHTHFSLNPGILKVKGSKLLTLVFANSSRACRAIAAHDTANSICIVPQF
jgi:hypothetical protein